MFGIEIVSIVDAEPTKQEDEWVLPIVGWVVVRKTGGPLPVNLTYKRWNIRGKVRNA